MARAIELSLESVQRGGGPFGAVVAQNGKLIAEGMNQVTLANDPSAHAEVMAIREACHRLNSFRLTGCELYSSCEPCPMCLGLIYWARPDKIYYANTAVDAAKIGFDDAHIYEEVRIPLSKRAIPHEQIMHKEALVAFRAWEQLPNKTTY
jgi:tRNA(Arg) A34 adenosine deaminase TadA